MFEVGEAVVHPKLGAGVVTEIKEMDPKDGTSTKYYKIKLLRQTRTSLMIPVAEAEERGIRRAIDEEMLQEVWQTLDAEPVELSSNHKSRYKLIREKLDSGTIQDAAEVIRDLSWRRHEEDGLTTPEKKLYRKGIRLLAGELAVAQEIKLGEAERQVEARLQKSFASR